MAVREVKLDPGLADPDIEIFIGQAQFGQYLVELRDAQGDNPQEIANGNNIDQISDKFPIGESATALKEKVVSAHITVAAPEEGPGQLYFAQISVTQGGKIAENGVIEYKGTFEDSKNMISVMRFV